MISRVGDGGCIINRSDGDCKVEYVTVCQAVIYLHGHSECAVEIQHRGNGVPDHSVVRAALNCERKTGWVGIIRVGDCEIRRHDGQ